MPRKVIGLVLLAGVIAAFMLGFSGRFSAAQNRSSPGLANPLEQRAEMIQELRAIRNLLREQNDLIREELQLLRKLLASPSKEGTP